MEGSPRDLRHAWHRHDPVRELSSRDPGLDQPASRGKTATTQPAMITPPAVLTVISLFPIPYTGTNKVGHSSWRGNRWMAGIEKGCTCPLGRTAIGSSQLCLRHNSGPQPGLFALNRGLTRAVVRDDVRNGVHCLARRAEAKVNLKGRRSRSGRTTSTNFEARSDGNKGNKLCERDDSRRRSMI